MRLMSSALMTMTADTTVMHVARAARFGMIEVNEAEAMHSRMQKKGMFCQKNSNQLSSFRASAVISSMSSV